LKVDKKHEMDQINKHPLYRSHNIDSAMSSIWEFYKQKFLPLFLISLAMSLAMQYAATFVNIKEFQTMTDPMQMLEKMKEYVVPFLIISLLNLLFTAILQHYIIYQPLDSSTNIGVSVLKALKYFIPYLIIMILLTFVGAFAIVLGFFALIVGAFFALLYLMTIYLFILPVLMIEDNSIIHTIRRTFTLLHKNFWPNLGWTAVFVIIIIVISLILSAIVLIPFTGGFLKSILNPQNATDVADITEKPLYLILSALTGALTLPVMPIFACILYFNAVAKEEEKVIAAVPEPEDYKVKVEDLYAKPYSDDHPDNPEKKDKE
jgi:hypothetical protein